MIEDAIAQILDRERAERGSFRFGKVSRVESTTGQPVRVTVGDGPDARVMGAAEQSTPLQVGDFVIWWDQPSNPFVLARQELGA